MIVLSLGAGVQSSVVLMMSARGELPKIDHAVFADTGWEPPAVYAQLKWLTKEVDIPISVVSKGDLRKTVIDRQVRLDKTRGRFASLPLFVLGPSGSLGMMRRQCTREYKVEPITKFIKEELLGYAYRARMPKTPIVEHWFGISVDEVGRTRDSTLPWSRNVYPLINYPRKMLTRAMTRADCNQWFQRNYPGRLLVKSACIGCPYRSNAEWRVIKSDPESWADALEFDAAIRDMEGLDGQAYLHADRMPLGEVNIDEDPDQFTFHFGNDCEGMCGV